jgi:selenide,water dikinase
LVGFENAEDALVFQLDAERALVATIDVITPLVDDPYDFGAIAAANALSDLAAMGASPLVSLSFLAAPKKLDPCVLKSILQGGGDVALAVGAPILGGHSVNNTELMFGLAAIGQVHPQAILKNSHAQVGDRLLLTKPLGTGTLSSATMNDKLDPAAMRPAIDGMRQTNHKALAPMRQHHVRAATDITGFGLLGHAAEVARASGVCLAFDAAAVPAYPHARDLLAAGVVTGASKRNAEYAAELGPVAGKTDLLLLDPQTSGGLLIAVAPSAAPSLTQALKAAGFGATTEVGEVLAGQGVLVR